jgi:hypothetical protein
MNALYPVFGRRLVWLLLFLCWPAVTAAQQPQILRVEAYAGLPFGVGKVAFRMGQSGRLIQNTGALRLSERDGRIFYPAFSQGLLTVLFDRPTVGGVQSVWFLFRGDAPLNLTLDGAAPVSFTADINPHRRGLSRILFQNWWRQFNMQARRNIDNGDYPPLIESYLTAMLERRLGLMPTVAEQFNRSRMNELQRTFQLVFDVESLRAETIRQMLKEPLDGELASLPVPATASWDSAATQPPAGEVATEPIVRFVPEECFYLRFGSWENQLWLKRLTEEYSGDLSRMISLRGHISGDTTRLLGQLALESRQMDDLFGGNLIADVAAIGTDIYLQAGPANAVLMLAKNGALETQMRSRRRNYAKTNADAGVTLTELQIAGHPVTLLATQDNRVRSFYAVKDRCHITSTSATIVRRFLEAADGVRSLADNPEFRQAREVMPVDRQDTVFVYMSRPFLENLLSPRYQIELSRRNRSLASIQLMQMARWAAANEGFDPSDIEGLIAQGFLPENFNQLPDGSTTAWVDDHWQDSLRGRRGFYKPIADMPVESVTAAESRWLGERIAFYQSQLKVLDPLLIAFQRFELSDEVERVVIDGRVAPFGQEKYGWLGRLLGPPLEWEVDMGPDALISVQASVAANLFSRTPESHQIFASVQGNPPPKTDLHPTNFFELMNVFKNTPGYVGAWPSVGYLDALPALGAPPDAEGYTYSRILDVWRLQQESFSLVSFDRQLLDRARQHLQLVPADRPAQVRLRVGDLSASNLKAWANILFFQRSWETSIANVELLNLVIQQFNLPRETARQAVEELLGVQLMCSLGGEYELALVDDSRVEWQSTHWPSFSQPAMPADYVAPPMQWFRGLSLDVYQRDTQFVVHGHLDIARDPASMGSGAGRILGNLPSIDLFKGFSKVEEIEPGQEQAGDNASREELPPGKKKDDEKKKKEDGGR